MIQRKQSIFLFLAAILMAVSFFVPLAQFSATGTDNILTLFSYGLASESGSTPIWGICTLAILGCIFPLVNIFLYAKRKLQMRVGTITIVFYLFFYVSLYLYVSNVARDGSMGLGNIEYGAILPLIAIILNVLAILGIKKDEKLIQSLNRIR